MSRYTDRLWADLAREHGPALAQAQAGRPEPGRVRRPRVIAGGTLAVAGGGAALALGLTATGGAPAFAVTTAADGSVQVTISQTLNLPQANAKLAAMGIHEQVAIEMVSGAGTASGPVTCSPAPGAAGPTVKVLVGTNGNEVIGAVATKGKPGAGTWHLASCRLIDPGHPGVG
jgi:hypothetical protein